MKRVLPLMLAAATARAGQGTLEVQVAKSDGTTCLADVEVRKAGGTTVVKKFVALTGGGGVTQLDPGDYDVKAVCRVGGHTGTTRATVKGGSITNYNVTAKAPAAAPPDLGAGKTHTVAGAVQKVDTGHVRVLLAGKEIGRASVKAGKFSLYDLKPGDYTLQLYDSANKKRVEKKITVKPQAVTLSP